MGRSRAGPEQCRREPAPPRLPSEWNGWPLPQGPSGRSRGSGACGRLSPPTPCPRLPGISPLSSPQTLGGTPASQGDHPGPSQATTLVPCGPASPTTCRCVGTAVEFWGPASRLTRSGSAGRGEPQTAPGSRSPPPAGAGAVPSDRRRGLLRRRSPLRQQEQGGPRPGDTASLGTPLPWGHCFPVDPQERCGCLRPWGAVAVDSAHRVRVPGSPRCSGHEVPSW